MDPEACLLACETYLDDDEYDLALDCFENYASWRSGLGFEPTINGRRGDFFYRTLRIRYGELTGRISDVPAI